MDSRVKLSSKAASFGGGSVIRKNQPPQVAHSGGAAKSAAEYNSRLQELEKEVDLLTSYAGDTVYRFNAECYKDTGQAILIWHDIWMPKSQIKIVWGELQDDFIIDVKLSVPRWLIKATMLGNYLKAD